MLLLCEGDSPFKMIHLLWIIWLMLLTWKKAYSLFTQTIFKTYWIFISYDVKQGRSLFFTSFFSFWQKRISLVFVTWGKCKVSSKWWLFYISSSPIFHFFFVFTNNFWYEYKLCSLSSTDLLVMEAIDYNIYESENVNCFFNKHILEKET